MRSVLEYARLNDFLIIALAYIVGYLVVDFIVAPVQYLYLSRDFTVGSLMFIPHGIRVLAVWLCGSRAILPLIIAELFCTVILWQPECVLMGKTLH
jgi:biotin transporter BioY